VRFPQALTAALLALLLLAVPATAAPLDAEADDDAIVVVNGDVVVEAGEEVEGIFIVSGNARIDGRRDVHVPGRVSGDVILVAGDARVAGRIEGDLVTIAGRARLLPGARVDGDLIYGDEAPRVAPSAVVAGEIREEGWDDSLGWLPFVGAFVFWLAVTISMAVLGILLLLIAPRAADAIHERARAQLGAAIAIGIAIFLVLPITAGIAAVTLVGLPLAIGIGLALLPLAGVAYVAAAWALGRAIVKPPRERILSFLVGLAILRLVALIPVLGILVWLGAVIAGLGLIGAAIGAARQQPDAARAPGS
jgi:cytoskeletal protein CcmA (bactofilin family)